MLLSFPKFLPDCKMNGLAEHGHRMLPRPARLARPPGDEGGQEDMYLPDGQKKVVG